MAQKQDVTLRHYTFMSLESIPSLEYVINPQKIGQKIWTSLIVTSPRGIIFFGGESSSHSWPIAGHELRSVNSWGAFW